MRVQSPISGAMTGSAGNITFQHYNGHTYGRSKPVIFHYGPTPNQEITQNKYYFVKSQWVKIYREILPYIPKRQFKDANPYNKLIRGIFLNLQTFSQKEILQPDKKFGFDIFDNQKIIPGTYQITTSNRKEIIKYDSVDYTTKVVFIPIFAHVFRLDPNTQNIQYKITLYQKKDIAFTFDETSSKSSSFPILYYIALSDRQYFSNFFQ